MLATYAADPTKFHTLSEDIIEETTEKRAIQEWEDRESDARLRSATRLTREIISIEQLRISHRGRLKSFNIISGVFNN